MGEWIEDLATACGQEPLTETETGELLRIAREVAHRVERKGTPLAAFLLGMRTAERVASGSRRAEVLAEEIRAIEGNLLPAVEEP